MRTILIIMCIFVMFNSCTSTGPSITYETVFIPQASTNYFGYHEQQTGNGCSIASATMYLRVLGNNSAVDKYDLNNVAWNYDYDYQYGLTGYETQSTMNGYMNNYWIKTYYPYSQFNGRIHPVIDYEGYYINNNALIFLSKSISQYKLGVCIGFTAHNTGYGPEQHMVFAYGIKRDKNKPYNYSNMTYVYYSNPQHSIYNTAYAFQLASKEKYVSFDPATVVYDQRVY